MLKVLNTLEHTIGSNVYSFLCGPQSPIPEIKEALAQMMAFVVSVENQQKASQAPAQPSPEAPVTDVASAPVAEATPAAEPAQPQA